MIGFIFTGSTNRNKNTDMSLQHVKKKTEKF